MARKNNLSRVLQELDKEQLIEEIEKLCNKFDIVKTYFDIEFSGDASRYLQSAQKEIERQFRTAKGELRNNPKASKLNKIVREFERISIYKDDVIDLMLYRIEQTYAYARAKGDVYEALFQSTERVRVAVMALIDKEDAAGKYGDRLKRLDVANWRYG